MVCHFVKLILYVFNLLEEQLVFALEYLVHLGAILNLFEFLLNELASIS